MNFGSARPDPTEILGRGGKLDGIEDLLKFLVERPGAAAPVDCRVSLEAK
jgi:hypothetical protein